MAVRAAVGRDAARNAPSARQRMEERGHDQRESCPSNFTRTVERRTGSVLERIADGVADDGGSVRRRALAQHLAVGIEQVTRLDVLLGVVPGAAAVVEDGGEQDSAMVPTFSKPATAW